MAMPVLGALHKPTATELGQITTQIDSLTAPGWTSYIPTWTNTTTNPALGNGTWNGNGTAWRRPANSDIVHFRIKLTWGSTTSPGTGSFWSFGFPTAVASADADCQGLAWLEDASIPGTRRFWHWFYFSGAMLVANEAGTVALGGSPWTWATSDTLRLRGSYQPA